MLAADSCIFVWWIIRLCRADSKQNNLERRDAVLPCRVSDREPEADRGNAGINVR